MIPLRGKKLLREQTVRYMKQNDLEEQGLNVHKKTSQSYKKAMINISVIDDDFIIRALLAQILESLTIKHLQLNIKVFERWTFLFTIRTCKRRSQPFRHP